MVAVAITVFPLRRLTILPAAPASVVLATEPTIGAALTRVPKGDWSDCASAIKASPAEKRSPVTASVQLVTMW
ncbi:MAG TPA: hypothetical protein VGL52_02080 [Casimicrobiaceae bacterium]